MNYEVLKLVLLDLDLPALVDEHLETLRDFLEDIILTAAP